LHNFAGNLRRVLGVHDLSAKDAARILGLSESAFSKWATGQRSPSFNTALTVGAFFDIPADRLARAEFGDLLEHELASKERFDTVEKKIAKARTGLRVVPQQAVAPANRSKTRGRKA
jgi:transcriptional regulator with XRE-family HTH domain